MQIEVLDSKELALKCVLAIYQSGDSGTVIRHEVDSSGTISSRGRVIDVGTTLEILSRAGKAPTSQREIHHQFSPAFDRLLLESPVWRVWYSKPHVHPLFIAGKPRKCWLPGLIWCGHRRERICYLWSYRGCRKPDLQTLCFRPRFGPLDGMNHIHSDSRICLGSMNPGAGNPKDWETAFYDSNFKTADGLPATPYDITNQHIKIGALEIALSRCKATD